MAERGDTIVSPEASTFVRELRFEALPADVVACAQRCLLDLAGVGGGGVAARRRRRSPRPRGRAHGRPASDEARLLFDGRRASLAGAAFAGAADDRRARRARRPRPHQRSRRRRGAAGAARVSPTARSCTGREFLDVHRAGLRNRHARGDRAARDDVPDYHCSGAWNALGCAALGARLLGLTTRSCATRWASPSTGDRAARSCAFASRRRC